jgi:hypothetical protein
MRTEAATGPGQGKRKLLGGLEKILNKLFRYRWSCDIE